MVYERLGLGVLKPTKMVLQLAHHSSRHAGGRIEDVLIKVEEFIFPLYIVVLETEVVISPKNEIPVILGQLFLATSNALVNCSYEK